MLNFLGFSLCSATTMFRLAKSIFLLSFAMATATIFDIDDFNALAGDDETLTDYSDLEVSILTKDGMTVRYLEGSFTFKEQLDESIQARFGILQKQEDGNFKWVREKNVTICEFFDDFYRNHLLPLTEGHNDFPKKEGSVCPIEARTYNVYEVDDFSELDAETMVPQGEYLFYVGFFKDDNNQIGGFEVQFCVDL